MHINNSYRSVSQCQSSGQYMIEMNFKILMFLMLTQVFTADSKLCIRGQKALNSWFRGLRNASFVVGLWDNSQLLKPKKKNTQRNSSR